MAPEAKHDRYAALLLPLFSARTQRDAGVGEIPAIPALARFARAAGMRAIQLLPIGECVHGDQSPYSSRSAFAVDPVYIGLDAVPDVAEALGTAWEGKLALHVRAALERARKAASVDYAAVRFVKERALSIAFAHFRDREIAKGSARAKAFTRFCEEERAWLADYALYRALEETHARAPWPHWPAALRDREPRALAERAKALEGLTTYQSWLQWTAAEQWREARAEAAREGVKLMGDLPFMVASESADAWAHREEFLQDASVGAPPDALAPDGQDWDLPPYNWPVFEAKEDAWIRERARRSAQLYDAYRVDHVVGYYRTYVIDRKTGARGFHPDVPALQHAQGERVLQAMMGAGAELIAEDLGTIPPFVRTSLETMELPGYRVVRWERLWEEPGKPVVDPRTYKKRTVATTGTHDTSNLVTWWEDECSLDDRRAFAALPGMDRTRAHVERDGGRACTDAIREDLLALTSGAASDIAIFPLQDILGVKDQVNVPGTVAPTNWSYRLPFALETGLEHPHTAARVAGMERIARRTGR